MNNTKTSTKHVMLFEQYINEQTSTVTEEQEIEAYTKLNKAVNWVFGQKPFYARVLQHVGIYIKYLSQETCMTDGQNIYWHPKVVLREDQAELRYDILHELLHIILAHFSRREFMNIPRTQEDYELFNIVADMELNSVLANDPGGDKPPAKGDQFFIPTNTYYEELFDGWRAEEIYRYIKERQEENEKKQKPRQGPGGTPGGEGDDKPGRTGGTPVPGKKRQGQGPGKEIDSDDIDSLINDIKSGAKTKLQNDLEMNNEDGEEITVREPDQDKDDEDDENKKKKEGEGQIPGKGGQEAGKGSASGTVDNIRATKGKNAPTSNVIKEKRNRSSSISSAQAQRMADKWENITQSALSQSGSSLSSKSRNILENLMGKSEAVIDWRRVLKRFIKKTFPTRGRTFPNRRFLSGGTYIEGRGAKRHKKLDEVVIGVDISGSVGEKQVILFINEVLHLIDPYPIQKVIILYINTEVVARDIFNPSKKEKPDFSKIPKDGGTEFTPFFDYIAKHNITPSLALYMTDGIATYPPANYATLSKYINKLLWLIVHTGKILPDSNKPPIGEYIQVSEYDFE